MEAWKKLKMTFRRRRPIRLAIFPPRDSQVVKKNWLGKEVQSGWVASDRFCFFRSGFSCLTWPDMGRLNGFFFQVMSLYVVFRLIGPSLLSSENGLTSNPHEKKLKVFRRLVETFLSGNRLLFFPLLQTSHTTKWKLSFSLVESPRNGTFSSNVNHDNMHILVGVF